MYELQVIDMVMLHIHIFFMEYRFLSVMKEILNISKILSGVGLIILRVLSLSFC